MVSSPWSPKSGLDPTIYGCTALLTGILGEAKPVAPPLGSHMITLWCQDPERTEEAAGGSWVAGPQ